jgi:DNA-binding response OmpR family regulator
LIGVSEAHEERSVKNVLIIEDDPDIVRLLTHYLEKEAYSVRSTLTGIEGLAAARAKLPDVLILDVMLPGLDGYEICKRLRGDPATATLPILMLTAKGDEAEKIVGLEIGADDYVTKPFSPKEVLARVKALLRRSTPSPEAAPGRLTYENLVVDTVRHEVTVGDRKLTLTAKEFGLLKYLLVNRGRLATREALLDAVWGYNAAVTSRTVDVHIRRLREKIPFLSQAIQTIKPYGYKLRDEADD